MRFRRNSDCASNFEQISKEVRRMSWQLLDKYSEKKENHIRVFEWKIPTSSRHKMARHENQGQEHFHHFLWYQGGCSQRVRPSRPNGKSCILLWRFTSTAWKCVRTPPRTLVIKELAFASRQGASKQTQHGCRPNPPYSPDLAPCDFPWLNISTFWHYWCDWGRIAGCADTLTGCI
jgi:hypothetical protein